MRWVGMLELGREGGPGKQALGLWADPQGAKGGG